jgi:hypothetical protein
VRILTNDPDALYEEHRGRGVRPNATRILDTGWGTRDLVSAIATPMG